MECNKEEAARAKDIAEKKMHDKDFVGARKFAQKAQQLYPEIDNITQLICVCDVHCSSENKMFRNEMDWYGILQVEQSADDVLIKKQYRKFALLLHPDKNKFAGAESAFKLVGEAQRVLLDREKRSYYDMKRRTSYRPVIPAQQVNRNSVPPKQPRAQSNFSSNLYSQVKVSNPPCAEQRQAAQPGAANGKETFWTLCPFCSVRYQYYKEVISKSLQCQNCKKPFIAYDMQTQGVRPGSNATTQRVFPQQHIRSAGASKIGSTTMNSKPASNAGFQSGKAAESNISQQGVRQSEKGPSKMERQGERGFSSSKKVNGLRSKKQIESSESFESDDSSDSEELDILDGDMRRTQAGKDGDLSARRSNRNKRRVSYNENASDDEDAATVSKKAKGDTPSFPSPEGKPPAADVSGSGFVKETGNGADEAVGYGSDASSTAKTFEADNGLDSSPETSQDPMFHEYPDPEFWDFDKHREERCFKPGQLWAAYDTADAMPRFYARINKISEGFKVKITWLEANPDDEDGKQWAASDLPYACGKFKRGDTEVTTDRLMFSHEVAISKSTGRGSFVIYPKMGEIWALFKNWSMKWCSIPEGERKFEYEFVEVLSDYDGTVGIQAAPLVKLKGFASLFLRKNTGEVLIPPSELLRFSHMVPSFRMSGAERMDVPKGSFELDPASTTMNLEEITLPLDKRNCVKDSSKFVKENPAVNMFGNSASFNHDKQKFSEMECGKDLKGNFAGLEVPAPEFYSFDNMKSSDKFQVNQVWALYSDADGLPTYYALVKKIDPAPNFKLHVVWLATCGPADMILWKDKTMPITCGEFKTMGKGQTYDDTVSFSHRLNAVSTSRMNVFAIYPRKGEVWALHRKWNADMKLSDLPTCNYDIVEVLEGSPLHTVVVVAVLERISGFKSVFKPLKNGSSIVTKSISRTQFCWFSHQIPCFRLNDEKGGNLRGFWELDPAALPVHTWHERQ